MATKSRLRSMVLLNQPQSVMQDIADSVNAGLDVTVSQSPVVYAGQTTSGYIVEDPTTGAAAYRIDAIADGGRVLAGIGFVLLMILMVILFQYALVAAIVLGVAEGAAAVGIWILNGLEIAGLVKKIIEAYEKCKSEVAPTVALGFVIAAAIVEALKLQEAESFILTLVSFIVGEKADNMELNNICPGGG